jgi:putative SOS response-associated peptidase YedK
LIDDVFRGVKDDPAAFEIRAAAAASSGDFKDAVKSQSKAVSMAGHLKWDVAPLNERLAHYTASQPWYGTLLEF